jgi:glycosyltransferase involved in cell wall biosynthesis
MLEAKVNKILFIDGSISLGGSTTGLLNIIGNFDRKRYKFSVALLYDGEHYQILNNKIDNLILLYPAFFKKMKVLKVIFLRIYHFFKLYILVKRMDIDLMHFNNFVYYPGILAAKLRGIPCVCHLRSLPVDYHTHKPKVTFLVKFFGRFIDSFIAISEAIKKEYVRYGFKNEKISVVGIGVPIEEIIQKSSYKNLRDEFFIGQDKMIIGFIGRFSWEKGVLFFIESLPGILRNLKNIQCIIIGSGPLRSDVKKSIESLSLNEKVILIDWEQNPYYILAGLDVLVVPSLREGRSRIITEALALGVPTVASRVGGIVELITDRFNGLLVDPSNASQIAESVTNILTNKNLRNKIRKNSINKAKNELSIITEVAAIEKIYTRTLVGGIS